APSALSPGGRYVAGAAARNSEAAVALLPVVLIPMVLPGGAVHPRHRMGEASKALSQAAPTRWAFEGLLLSEAAARPTFRPPAPPGIPPERRDVAEAFFPDGAERGSAAGSAALLGGMLAGGVLLVIGVLRSRDIH